MLENHNATLHYPTNIKVGSGSRAYRLTPHSSPLTLFAKQ